MKRCLITVASCALALAGAAPAGAASLQVDDDGAQCPASPYATIQSAIDAATAGDAVRVCPGTYREQVRVPQDKPRLKLISTVPHGATIVASTDPAAYTPTVAGVVQLLALDTLIRGFVIAGPLPRARDLANDCFVAAGVTVENTSATVDSNRIVDIRRPGCPDAVGIGVFNTGLALVVNNEIERFGDAGVVADDNSGTRILRNRIANPDGEGAGILVGGASARVQANDVSGTEVGILGSISTFSRVLGNSVYDNDVGISIGNQFDPLEGVVTPIWSNRVFDNRIGLELRGASNLSVRGNRVRDNAEDGIVVDAASFNNLLRGNTSLGNGGLDCSDQGGAPLDNLWRDNVGRSDDPDGICRAP